jgi:hypothetical protein
MSNSNVIPFKETPAKCSFCGTTEKDAKHFFSSGTGKHICGVCVAHCKQRVQNEEQV